MISLRGARVLRLGLAAAALLLTAFHLLLLVTRLADGSVLDPAVATEWVVGLLLLLGLVRLHHSDASLLKSLELKCQGFEFCPEVTAKVSRLGESITEVPISYEPRSIEEGKKIRWTDGLMAIWVLFKYRFWRS